MKGDIVNELNQMFAADNGKYLHDMMCTTIININNHEVYETGIE